MSADHLQPTASPAGRVRPARAKSSQGLGFSGFNYWRRLGWKIALLSAHGSLLTLVIFLPFSLWSMGTVLGAGQLGGMAIWLFVSLPMTWIGSLVWSWVLGLLLLPGVSLSLRLLGEPVRQSTVGWIAGSTIGTVGLSLSVLQMSYFLSRAGAMNSYTVWVLGTQLGTSLLSTAAKQSGGYLASMNDLRRRRTSNGSAKPLRFSIWRLMAITALVSVLLSLLRFTGEFMTPVIGVLVLSSVIAWAIHRPVAWATNRWLDWRLKKRRAKREALRVATQKQPPASAGG